ncbi:MAG: hypothetical protein ACI4K6_02785 [Candidatus Fimenecus sp.]
MDSISELLSSVSPEELERLKGVAQSLISSNGNSEPAAPPKKEKSDASLDGIASLFGGDTAKMLTTVAKALNQEDDRTKFIAALKPLLSEERRQRADEAMRFLRLMDALPLLKGLF